MSSNNSAQQGEPAKEEFFRPIGEQAEAVDELPDDDDQQMQPTAAAAEAGSSTAGGGGAEQQQKMVEEVESVCMRCGENGTTRMLLTSIPYFKEVIVMSFYCPHCHESNNEVQSAGEIQEKGIMYTLHLTSPSDLNRSIVKAGTATITLPELELEIPPKRGQFTTVEGILRDTVRDLQLDQPVRRAVQPEVATRIDALCGRLNDILGDTVDEEGNVVQNMSAADDSTGRNFRPFTLKLDDPSGNSFLEFSGDVQSRGKGDSKWTKREYKRTQEQNALLGLAPPPEAPKVIDPEAVIAAAQARADAIAKGEDPDAGGGFNKEAGETEFDNEEIYTFPDTCSSCSAPLMTNMKKVAIPYFKEILIMSTNCDRCGYRDNEVKSGAAISPTGRKLTLRVEDASDLTRDILKSETAGLAIPSIELSLDHGTLGGRFTTLEGLLQQIYDELASKALVRGDAFGGGGERERFEAFLDKLKAVMECREDVVPYDIELDDPLANSYIQNPYAPDPDEQVKVDNYERSFDQNEELGLNDINTENYKDPKDEEMEDADAAAEAADEPASQEGNPDSQATIRPPSKRQQVGDDSEAKRVRN
ncbi:nucleolar zinc-finger protein [Tilletia horrida]|uniref:Nucleolar zinc-finger protein n=1 Tax=Tilletia horrida TaxID=155126 RepID=A0AAN6GBT2_9BASI|nr:nucleolar zinc-finger protein [Tilletia horrida]KAK0536024.1 nucleolar zinc-finger protein [Tilletia horrida]KAK0560534.1 nucleolar zinc-finger protein [Tilletia horrida]